MRRVLCDGMAQPGCDGIGCRVVVAVVALPIKHYSPSSSLSIFFKDCCYTSDDVCACCLNNRTHAQPLFGGRMHALRRQMCYLRRIHSNACKDAHRPKKPNISPSALPPPSLAWTKATACWCGACVCCCWQWYRRPRCRCNREADSKRRRNKPVSTIRT